MINPSTIRIQSKDHILRPRIAVVGVGGAGGNAVNNMILSSLEGCEFIVCNTDAQALNGNAAMHKVQLGANVTRGLGAGANPEIGRAAAEESIEDILSYLEGSNMVFVTAGMGGGTGTGAAPVIAQAAREAGILTIGVVTKPFHFEGTHRMRLAENGIIELQKHVDTLIVIPNQNLFRIANEKTTFSDAFRMADEVLQSGVRGVTDLMVMPGQINLDFADVRAVMAEMGKAMMGTGTGTGERRAVDAAEKAISNPLLDGVEIKGARGVLINVIGGSDLTLFEIDEAVNRIREEVDPDANIIFGSTMDENLNGAIRISVVATGIDTAVSVARSGGSAGDQRRPTAAGRPSAPLQNVASYAPARPAPMPAPRPSDFALGGLPPSILPGQSVAARSGMMATMSQPSYETETMSAAPLETTAPALGSATPAQAPSAPQSYGAAAATARKLDATAEESATWTRPVTPPAQNYDRNVPPPSQPRGTRIGNVFIPPRPVDPRSLQAGVQSPASEARNELFGAEETTKTAKKSPSFFERLTLQREKPQASPPVTEARNKEDDGLPGGGGDDDLDIPAFLRRQAN